MEFDEVSSVDRPANQHGLIAISKSLMEQTIEEDGVSELYSEAGEQVSEDALQHGDVVFDGAGNEYVYVIEDDLDDDDDDVEKASPEWLSAAVRGARGAGEKMRSGFRGGFDTARGVKAAPVTTARAMEAAPRSAKVGDWIARNPGKAALAGAGAGAGAVGVAGGGAYMIGRKDSNMEKSLGDSVLEQLSKAVSEADREEIIAKALDEVEIAKAQAEAAREELAWLQDQRITDAFISKAAEYNLPVSPEVFGPILKAAAEVLDDEQLEILDHVLTAAGEAIYDEIGYAGGAANSIFDQVNGFAAEMVEKSAGDYSLEQASTAMFAANPDAYDAYIAEQNGR